jgi:hypothetical protein
MKAASAIVACIIADDGPKTQALRWLGTVERDGQTEGTSDATIDD